MQVLRDVFRLVGHEEWLDQADDILSSEVPPFVVKSGGTKLRVAPGLCRQRGVRVLGHDWLPILPDGRFTLQGMVHTPLLYAAKIRNLERVGEHTWQPAYRRLGRLNEPAVLVGGSRNYYHWLINHLPRLLWLRERGLLAGRRILVNDALTGFQRDSLALLGIDQSAVHELADDEALECDDLLVPDFFAANTITHPFAVKLLRDAYLPAAKAASSARRRIHLSRRDASNRRLKNEPAAEALAATLGFESITTAGMPFADQVRLFAEATAVLGVHGAGLTTLVFSPAGTQVIEIALPSHRVSSMRMLSLVCGHVHDFVDASTGPLADGINPLLVDWSVDEADLARRLGTLSSARRDPRVG